MEWSRTSGHSSEPTHSGNRLPDHPATLKGLPISSSRIYQYAVFLTALASGMIATAVASPAGSENVLLAAVVCALVAFGRSFEFRISAHSSSHLGTPALLTGAMLLSPRAAIITVGLGIVLNEVMHRKRRATLFNIGQSIYQTLVAVGTLHAFNWNPADPNFGAPVQIIAAITAGLLAITVSILLVGVRNWFDADSSLAAAVWAVTGEGNREIALLDVSKVCIGVIAAMLADWTPLFIIFLFVPVATMSRAIKRGGDLYKRLELALDETEHSLAEAQRLAKLGSWEWILARREMTWSNQLYAILGLQQEERAPVMSDLYQMMPLPDRNRLDLIINEVRRNHGSGEFDHEIIQPDGELRYVSHRISWAAEDDRAGERLVGTLHDITERKRLELRLRYQAFHDGLTGLPNREYFLEKLQECLSTTRCHAVIFIDLDFFKLINDNYGHETGDLVLIEVSQRLRQAVGSNDFVARLSGDEFTVLACSQSGAGRVQRLANDILSALRKPLVVENDAIAVAASAGVVYVAAHHESPSDVLREADTALYVAKGDGRGRVFVHEDRPGPLSASA